MNNIIEYYVYTPTQLERFNRAARTFEEMTKDPFLQRYMKPAFQNLNDEIIGSFTRVLTPELSTPFARVDLDRNVVTYFTSKEKMLRKMKNDKLIYVSTAIGNPIDKAGFLKEIHVDEHMKPTDDYFEYQQEKFNYKKILGLQNTKQMLKEQLGDFVPNNKFHQHHTIVATSRALDPFLTKLRHKMGSVYPEDEEYRHVFVQGLLTGDLWYQQPILEFEFGKLPLILSVPAPSMVPDTINMLADPQRIRLEIWEDHQFKHLPNNELLGVFSSYSDAKEKQTLVLTPQTENEHFYTTMITVSLKKQESTMVKMKQVTIQLEFGTPIKADLNDNNELQTLYTVANNQIVGHPAKHSGVYLYPVNLQKPANVADTDEKE